MGSSDSTPKSKKEGFDESMADFAQLVQHCNASVCGSDKELLEQNRGKDVSSNPLEDYDTFRLYLAQLNSLIVKNMPFLKAQFRITTL